MESQLTQCQQIVLEAIKKYYDKNKKSPTLSELLPECGIYTRSTVHKHLHNLENKGYIKIIPKKKRGIILK